MNLRKAAEMALEVLENLQGGCTDSDDGTVEAITVWCPEIIDALKEALAEPEQEPVAYRTVNNVGAYVYHSADRLPNEYGLRGDALYLHPAPIPEGWQLVNRNMTPEQRQLMLRAEEFTVDEMWIMSLATAPKPEDV